MAFLLLVTWLAYNQPPDHYQVPFERSVWSCSSTAHQGCWTHRAVHDWASQCARPTDR